MNSEVFTPVAKMSRIKKSSEKSSLSHGLALIGVRGVLGIENVTGSPFNIQRSLHIPNLTFDEVRHMFDWYAEENGQSVEALVSQNFLMKPKDNPV